MHPSEHEWAQVIPSEPKVNPSEPGGNQVNPSEIEINLSAKCTRETPSELEISGLNPSETKRTIFKIEENRVKISQTEWTWVIQVKPIEPE